MATTAIGSSASAATPALRGSLGIPAVSRGAFSAWVAACSAWSSGTAQRMAKAATAAKMTPLIRKCQGRGRFMAAAAVPMRPPITAPTLHRACMELMMEVPARRCTRSPCAFCAVSTRASSMPATNNPIQNTATRGTDPATNTAVASRIEPTTATRAVPNLRRMGAGRGPATTPPMGNAISANPYRALDRSYMSLISGKRGNRLEKIAPLVRNSRDTAMRARVIRRRSMAGGGEAGVTPSGYGPGRVEHTRGGVCVSPQGLNPRGS